MCETIAELACQISMSDQPARIACQISMSLANIRARIYEIITAISSQNLEKCDDKNDTD